MEWETFLACYQLTIQNGKNPAPQLGTYVHSFKIPKSKNTETPSKNKKSPKTLPIENFFCVFFLFVVAKNSDESDVKDDDEQVNAEVLKFAWQLLENDVVVCMSSIPDFLFWERFTFGRKNCELKIFFFVSSFRK